MKIVVTEPSTSCEDIQFELAGIASMVNRKMHVINLHERVDIFFYIDSSIKAHELCLKLRYRMDEGDSRKLTELHKQVTERWKQDRNVLSPRSQIIL